VQVKHLWLRTRLPEIRIRCLAGFFPKNLPKIILCWLLVLIRSNFRQMAMDGENSPKIIVKPDGQAK